MSDYIFSSVRQPLGFLSGKIKEIYHSCPPEITEIHGEWGTMAVSVNHYNGFLPYENDRHLLVSIGGPVLYFRDNSFLAEEDSSQATEAIYKRWIEDKIVQWDEDLSGPFTFILIDKNNGQVNVITDLMAFIPVYCYQDRSQLVLGTHVDAVAKACHQENNYDNTSLADFLLNEVVTFPFTVYKNIKQLHPSSIIEATPQNLDQRHYWLPRERQAFTNLNEAAMYLRNGISGFVDRVTEDMSEVAHFISAGEDSRSLAGMMPRNLKRKAYIFIDHMNREGEIAGKVADIYGAEFNVGYRSKNHYLDILPEATDLVGNGHSYTHAHSLGFDKDFKLAEHTAVFGGYLSDSLLKGVYTRKIRGAGRFPFFPDHHLAKETRSNPIESVFVKKDLLDEVNKRRASHLVTIQSFREKTQHEWFVLWPATMRVAIPNLYSTRRLFKSYEPFMCKEAVKVSASAPITWKLNRRLFNKAMKPCLKPTKWLLHADGRLPYFSWWVNIPIQFLIWSYRHVEKRIGGIKVNQGPWGDWKVLFNTQEWQDAVKSYTAKGLSERTGIFTEPVDKLLMGDNIKSSQKANIMQILYWLNSGK